MICHLITHTLEQFEEATAQADPPGLVSLAQLANRYETREPLLKERLKILKLEPRIRGTKLYLDLRQLKQLDEYYYRLRLGWSISLTLHLNDEFRGI